MYVQITGARFEVLLTSSPNDLCFLHSQKRYQAELEKLKKGVNSSAFDLQNLKGKLIVKCYVSTVCVKIFLGSELAYTCTYNVHIRFQYKEQESTYNTVVRPDGTHLSQTIIISHQSLRLQHSTVLKKNIQAYIILFFKALGIVNWTQLINKWCAIHWKKITFLWLKVEL